jgi:hypothetical protein
LCWSLLCGGFATTILAIFLTDVMYDDFCASVFWAKNANFSTLLLSKIFTKSQLTYVGNYHNGWHFASWEKNLDNYVLSYTYIIIKLW